MYSNTGTLREIKKIQQKLTAPACQLFCKQKQPAVQRHKSSRRGRVMLLTHSPSPGPPRVRWSDSGNIIFFVVISLHLFTKFRIYSYKTKYLIKYITKRKKNSIIQRTKLHIEIIFFTYYSSIQIRYSPINEFKMNPKHLERRDLSLLNKYIL